MSVVAAMDQKHELKGPPSACDVAELANKMALTSIKEHDGNNPDLVTGGDLSPSEAEEKDSGFSSEEGPEYDVADPIDHLASLSERDIDDTVLEELGPGEKRSRDPNPQEEREEGVPSKRSSHPTTNLGIRPPPQHLSRLKLTPVDPAPGVKKATNPCRKPGHRPSSSATTNAAFCPPGYMASGQGSVESPQHYFRVAHERSNRNNNDGMERPTAAPFLPPQSGNELILSDKSHVASWLRSSPYGHPGVWGSGRDGPVSPQDGSSPGRHTNLPTEVSADGTSAAQEEENRRIQQILKDLICTSPQGYCLPPESTVAKGAPSFANPQNNPLRMTGSSVAVQSPAGSAVPGFPKGTDASFLGRRPEGLASAQPPGWKGEQPMYPPQRGAVSAVQETRAQTSIPVLKSPQRGLPNPPPDICTGPPPPLAQAKGPPGNSAGRRRCVEKPQIPAMALPAGNRPAVSRETEASIFQRTRLARTLSEASSVSATSLEEASSAAFMSPATNLAGGGSAPDRGSLLKTGQSPGQYQRQDSSSSEASWSSTPSVRPSTGQTTTHTCLSSMGACGAVVTCNDISPANPPPSPFSPSRDSAHAAPAWGPESPNAALSHAWACSYPPAASPYSSSSQSHVSPRAYSFPPTPESDCQSVKSDCQSVKSDCQSPRGRTTRDASSPASNGCPVQSKATAEQVFLLSSGSSMVIGSVGLPTPPHRCFVEDSASFSFHPHPLSQVPPSPNLPSQSWAASLCTESAFPHVGNMTCGMVPLKEEGKGKKEEEEEVDYEEEVVEEVLDVVCDENGVWQTDDDDGDNFLHSLSGMPKETVAVEYLHRLRHKPGFLQALNAFNSRLETALYVAVCLGKVTLVAHMLQVGADVNIQCHYGDKAHTPLHRAVERGEIAMVDVLLRSHHINLNARRGSDHCTALMVALMRHVAGDPRHNRLDIISKIVEEDDGLDLQARDPRSGKTALMMAIETKDARVVDAMLNDLDLDKARHLINMQNRAGNSAVHVAAGLRDAAPMVKKHMLRKLIELGGDTNKRNNEGETPKQWAQHLIDQVARLQ